MRRQVGAAACAVLLGLPVAASAQNRPTYVQRALIFYGMAKGDQSRGPGCYAMRVSTVDRRWAVAWVQQRRHESVQHFVRRCNPGNGVIVMHKRHGRWRHAFDTEPGYKCRGHISDRVGEDLRVQGTKLCGPAGSA